jgi:PrgI family protein
MATYKVIQDIEADDKLIWQLSFRQFVYALIAVLCLYVSYLFFTKHVGFLAVITLPIAFFTGFLAFPFGKDQPTEVWALAKLRFFLKPRRRIWAQSGVKEMVTITVPKKVEVNRTNGLSQTEVKSRLQTLANTIDSRGWAVKNASSIYQSPLDNSDGSDRLVTAVAMPQNPDDDIPDSDDVMDMNANPVAQQMGELIDASDAQHRQKLYDTLNQIKAQQASATQPASPAAPAAAAPAPVAPVVQQVPTAPAQPPVNEAAINNELKSLNQSQHVSLDHMRTLNIDSNASTTAKSINGVQPQPATPVNPVPQAPVATAPDPAIINLANRNDLNVDVIAHEINKAKKSASKDEVLISLR